MIVCKRRLRQESVDTVDADQGQRDNKIDDGRRAQNTGGLQKNCRQFVTSSRCIITIRRTGESGKVAEDE